MKKYSLHLLSIVTITIFILLAYGSSDSDTGSSSPSDNKFLAYSYAEDFVKQKLKSPSSAEFPGTFEKDEHITELGNRKYKINSWVDSQNSFGAQIRTNFSCTITFDGDNVYCNDLMFE
jgi:hypothetical protein